MSDIFGFGGKAAFVLGLGLSGLSVARALQGYGVRVMVWDDGEAARKQAEEAGFYVQNPEHVEWHKVGALVKSPGIPTTHPAAMAARKSGADVLGDIDLFWLARQSSGARFIGITGTNGKSTTTALVGHILEQAGFDVQVGGNIGVAPFEMLNVEEGGFYVLELSSYQLETLRYAAFDAAVFLNLTPDHLERHGTMGQYLSTKLKLLKAVKDEGVRVLGIDSEPTRKYAEEHPAGLTTVSIGATTESGFENLPGPHNAQNIACAKAVVQAFLPAGFDVDAAIRSFGGLPHRMERVGEKHGILFINDSKATNGDSTVPALRSFENIYWICGGKPKTDGLGAAVHALENVRHAFTVGQAGPAFAETLRLSHVPVQECGTIDAAVQAAYEAARLEGLANPVVVLSPAAASQDQFRNFEERGNMFVQCVNTL